MKELLITLPQHKDNRGILTVAEEVVPFKVERVFFITDVPEGSVRGGHLHKTCDELVVCLSGQFTMVVDDGQERKEFVMDSPSKAIWIPAGMWCSLENWHRNTVVCVLASEKYNEEGYVR